MVNLLQLLDNLRNSREFLDRITCWEEIPPKKADYSEFPVDLHPELVRVLKQKGIKNLYSHQRLSFDLVASGKDIVVVTPTASGKTLCYNLPVLNNILKDKQSRALYLFPTKALSQDQVAELYQLVELLGADIKTYTYDGDTPPNARKAIRKAGHIVVTNPDMLHTGILPHHTKWVRLFENLRYIIIDEVHTYRGVFGSHVANVIRRLKRICRFYGSNPVFICASATIANPHELVERLIERPVELIDNNGAPGGKKHFIFYNPPVINRQLGIRRSYILETKKLAEKFLRHDIQTIIFARTRLQTEVLVTYLKKLYRRLKRNSDCIRGYRGGYLPRQRREIEKGLRAGEVKGVVSTNALELGIDIGRLEACIMAGYPGSVASTWQQAGRAGRSTGESVAILVASSSPLDQYIINNPEYFFSHPTEHGLINPNNLIILLSHIKCAAFELPFAEGEDFGVETLTEILQYLEEERILRYSGGRWYWMSERYPADEISLRSASPDNFVIVDITGEARVIGEVDRFSAPMLIHEDAIYIHESQQYHVEELDWEEQKAYVKQVDVDYYTDANLAVDLEVLECFADKNLILDEDDEENSSGGFLFHGEVAVTAKATVFKKIKFHTHENVGYGDINLPEQTMHTTSFWWSLPLEMEEKTGKQKLQSALLGISNLLVNIAPLYLMCDPRDIKVISQVKSPFTGLPTIFLYDNYPGGVGFSEKLFSFFPRLLRKCREVIQGCSCSKGCPSCVGPLDEIGPGGKEAALKIFAYVLDGQESSGGS